MAKELLGVVIMIVLLAVIGSSAGLFGGNHAYLDYGYEQAARGADSWLVGALVALFFIVVFGMLALGVYIGLSQARFWFIAGADASQRGREIDERSDAQKTAALAGLARAALTLGARSAPADQAPIIAPLETQGAWLPELEEYHRPMLPEPDPDVWDIEVDGESDTDV